MDFTLTEEQLMLQATVREFAQKELKPVAAEYDSQTDPRKCFPWDVWKKAHALGLVTLPIAPERGGAGAGILTQVIVCEELGAGDGSFAKGFGSHLQKLVLMEAFMNEQQKKEFITKVVENDTYIVAACTTEPEHASDNLLPYDEPGATMKTFAYRDGDEYVINGIKRFSTLSGVAKLLIVNARTEKNKPISQAMSAFMVPIETPGISFGHHDDTMGGRAECRVELIFDNVRVPARYLLIEENTMWGRRHRTFHGPVCVVAAGIGEARTCYEETKAFAKTRMQGGKPIIEHTNIGTKLVEMHVGLEASRMLLYKVAWSLETQHIDDPILVNLLRPFVMPILTQIYLNALEIWGGMGTQKESHIERYFRNHLSSLHAGGGTIDINKIRAMKML